MRVLISGLCALKDMQDCSRRKNRHAVFWGGMNPQGTGGQFLQLQLEERRWPLAMLNEFGKQEGLGAGRRGCQLPSGFSPTPFPVVLRISSSFEEYGGTFLASYVNLS